MDFEALYTNLGFLFYSVAAADGRVSAEERDKLLGLIKERWLPLENSRDEVGMDNAHYIDIAFDHAMGSGMSATDAFARFAEHMRMHALELGPGMRRMIYHTAATVASATAGNNKSELTRLTALEELFHKHPAHVQA